MQKQKQVQHYQELVLSKYHLYNSLFMNLPYERLSNIGMLIPILHNACKSGFEAGKNPLEIIPRFFEKHTSLHKEEDRIDFLFRMVQYIERQVVLFDSIEDASFQEIQAFSNNKNLTDLGKIARANNQWSELKAKLNNFGVRIVFTAHPTQFYPNSVQGIIEDLRSAIPNNDINQINRLLQQLGKTSFLNNQKPSPLDEAKSIIYYLRYVYYDAIGELYENIQNSFFEADEVLNPDLIKLGFWPGGDRDGNPFVTAEITKHVADNLRMELMKCYYNQLKNIRRRLTFKGIDTILMSLSDKLYENMFSINPSFGYPEIITPLLEVRRALIEKHNRLFLVELDRLIQRVRIFKTHFACLDIRQDHSKHEHIINAIVARYKLSPKAWSELNVDDRLSILLDSPIKVDADDFDDPIVSDTILNIQQLKKIQMQNGEDGCNRYIISNSEDIFSVFNVFALFRYCSWEEETIRFDIVPLFETIKGMDASERILRTLFENSRYRDHLQRRGNKQTIMLGFSDGTKDGGYLKANWGIFNTKENLSQVCTEYGIEAIFFDGRGGPPARGGGKTHRFYASQGKHIANHEIQLTIQGQTITSMYGTKDQFNYNCEQLISAGIENELFASEALKITDSQRDILNELAHRSFEKYDALKKHPQFIPYLEQMSTLRYYAKAKIGSRPAKRGQKKELTLSDLRAISFVGSWSQLKQNVPGYFGIGTALQSLIQEGRIQDLKDLFANAPFFRALILNSMMSMTKSFFPATAYMQTDKTFGSFWQILKDEFDLTHRLVLDISETEELMEQELLSRMSIKAREDMVLPLITIQQYSLQKVAQENSMSDIYEKIVMRSMFGNINASRNSA